MISTITNPTGIFIGAGVENSSIVQNNIRTLKYTGTGRANASNFFPNQYICYLSGKYSLLWKTTKILLGA
jgi:hypothetical protein